LVGGKKPSNAHFSITDGTRQTSGCIPILQYTEWNCSHLRIVPPIALEIAAQKGYKYFEAIRFLIIRNVFCHYDRKLECCSQDTTENAEVLLLFCYYPAVETIDRLIIIILLSTNAKLQKNNIKRLGEV
jgi:hypothetical protein